MTIMGLLCHRMVRDSDKPMQRLTVGQAM